jgi:hypothetical protein
VFYNKPASHFKTIILSSSTVAIYRPLLGLFARQYAQQKQPQIMIMIMMMMIMMVQMMGQHQK